MQPYLFPYLGYWQLLNAVDEYIVLDDVTFIKQGYINRNSILGNGKAQPFNIQVKDISSNKLINEHELNPDPRWKKKLLKTLKQNYSKAPYCDQVMALLEDCLNENEQNLAVYLTNILKKVSEYAGIETNIQLNSERSNESDLTGQERILQICNEMGASEYFNAIGGAELYDKAAFANEGIELKFLKMNQLEYDQGGNEFVPYLSIIDVMMFNEPDQIRELLDQYQVV